MYERINRIGELRNKLEALAIDKAKYTAAAERAMAVTLIKLKQGVELKVDGRSIKNPPVTIMKEIAKGVCWEERLNADKAEASYKATIVNMQALSSELNGYQSINKYLKDEL